MIINSQTVKLVYFQAHLNFHDSATWMKWSVETHKSSVNLAVQHVQLYSTNSANSSYNTHGTLHTYTAGTVTCLATTLASRLSMLSSVVNRHVLSEFTQFM